MKGLTRCTLGALMVAIASSAQSQEQNGVGFSFGAASPSGKLTKAFSLGSTIEAFGATKTRYEPVSLRLGVSYSRLSAGTDWSLAIASVEPTMGYSFSRLPLTPSIFGGPGWYSVADKATQNGSVNGVEMTRHSFRRAAFGYVYGAGIEFSLMRMKLPVTVNHHSVPGFLAGGGVVKFNTISIGLKF
jgi:hypothetical protein